MNKKSLKIAIGVFSIIIVVLIAMILLKGKNLNPFAPKDESGMKMMGEEGKYHESISISLPEGASSYYFEDGGSVQAGEMFQEQIGE